MNKFPFLDETKCGFDPAATPSEKMKVETATVKDAYSFVGINAWLNRQ